VWAYDFVFDTCADGRQLKCLTVIDEFTQCLAIDVAGGIRSGRVIEVLTQLASVHGAPRYLRSYNDPEFVARAVLRWLQTAQIETAFIDPASPGRTAPTNRPMGSRATSTSRCSGFEIAPTRRSASKPGAGTTTRSGRTPVSGT
jgi:putative transposase